jgi:hypothetical protein
MHDALDIRTVPRCPAAAAAAVCARRPGARRPLLRKAFDDWEGTRDRCLAPA